MIKREIVFDFETFLNKGELIFQEIDGNFLNNLENLYLVDVYVVDNFKKFVYFSLDYRFLYLLNEEHSVENKLFFSRDSKFYKNEMSILINNQCNLSCNYCFSKKGTEKLTFEVLKPFLDFFVHINRFEEKVSIFFSGMGEPLLEIETIKRIVEYINDKLLNTEKEYGILSNLTLLNDEILYFLKKYNFKIIGSYDGLGFSENRINNNEFLEKKVIENIYKILSYDLDLKINLVVTKKHILNKEKLLEVLKSLISLENVSFLYLLSNYNDYNREYTVQEYYDFLKFFTIKRYNEFSTLKNYQDFFRLMLTLRICNLRWSILPNGNVVSCGTPFFRSILEINDFNNIYYMFNIKNNLNQITYPKYNKMFVDSSRKCSNCFYKPFCRNCIPYILKGSEIVCLNKLLFKEVLKNFLLDFLKNH